MDTESLISEVSRVQQEKQAEQKKIKEQDEARWREAQDIREYNTPEGKLNSLVRLIRNYQEKRTDAESFIELLGKFGFRPDIA